MYLPYDLSKDCIHFGVVINYRNESCKILKVFESLKPYRESGKVLIKELLSENTDLIFLLVIN